MAGYGLRRGPRRFPLSIISRFVNRSGRLDLNKVATMTVGEVVRRMVWVRILKDSGREGAS